MDSKDRTLYCANLSDKVTEDLLYELFLQAGPLESVTIPKDKEGRQRTYGFITFKHAVSVEYAIALMWNISLYGKTLLLKTRNGSTDQTNPYLQKLVNYRNSFMMQNMSSMDNRAYGYPQRDSFDEYSRRHRRAENEFDSRNSFPGPSSYPLMYNTPYANHLSAHNAYPQRSTYSPRYDQNPWSANRR